jgi:molybdopterin-guanine dinucleotide biosynthesis protein A
MDARTKIVGVALAGGASRRMGRDKAALRWSGSTLLERTVERLAAVCAEVVVADRGRGLLADTGTVSVDDGPGGGPAAGILGAATAHPGRDLLVLACDLPRVPASLLSAIAALGGGADWVVPAWGEPERLEPLCALYRPAALAALAGRVDRGRYALHRLIEAPGLAVRRLGREALEAHGRPAEMFLNVNAPEDFAVLRGGAAAR